MPNLKYAFTPFNQTPVLAVLRSDRPADVTADQGKCKQVWSRSTSLKMLCAVFTLALVLGTVANGKIRRIQITRVESPTFEGTSFGMVGQYEKLVGRAYGEVDPNDPHNVMIADVALAPRNTLGMVEYSTDVYILRPVDRSAGNHRVFFEINNRGNITSFSQFNDATSGGNDPTTALDAGNGFLMRQGYTIVLSGWDVSVMTGGGRQTISVPIAHNPDGSSIVGLSLEEFVIDNSSTSLGILSYPASTLDKSMANLSVRVHYADAPTSISAAGWEYVTGQSIRLLPAGTRFQQGTLYEFSYLAKDPVVAGLAFAATRDLTAFFHHAETDESANPNPLAGDVQFVYAYSFSQPARFMRDFLQLGFNEDEEGRRVFDGILNWVAGASGGYFNYRFAQPARTHRQHIGRWFPEREFPFADQIIFDPFTGKTDGRLRRCLMSATCPRIFEVNSENEYWVKGASLLHTDTLANDLADPDNVRFYLLSNLAHAPLSGPGICQQFRNPLVPNPALRALLVALDHWASAGAQPPNSRVPRREDGTLVPAMPQSEVGFPAIPGVIYNGLMTTGDLFNYGSTLDQGILSNLPPIFVGSPYVVLVPKTDGDGHDIAGVKLPEIAVPIATYTGWGLRATPFAGNDLCDAAGQKIDFKKTAIERIAAGDPRLSIEERYPTHGSYVNATARAANSLYKQGFLLAEDVERYVQAASESDIGK